MANKMTMKAFLTAVLDTKGISAAFREVTGGEGGTRTPDPAIMSRVL